MKSLGYLLLFSLVIALISPSSAGYYRKPRCPQSVNRCQSLSSCQQDSQCGSGQSCCDTGCGLKCISGIFSFFKNLFPCSGGGCGGGCSGGRCGGSGGGGCSGGRCGGGGGGCSGGSCGGGGGGCSGGLCGLFGKK